MRKIEDITLEYAVSELEDEFEDSAGAVMLEYITEGYKEIWDVEDGLFRRVRDNYSDAPFDPAWKELKEVLEMYEGAKDEKVNLFILL